MADTPDRGPLPLTNDMADRIDWKKGDGLVPAIVQNAEDGQVLMLGYMNRDALMATLESGYVTFYSRSKKRLWMKGESSGNRLAFVDGAMDCDGDTLLVRVWPAGPACAAYRASLPYGCAHLFW